MSKIYKKILLLSIIITTISTFTINNINAHTWQSSTSPSVMLAVRDKYGNFNNVKYEANFVVYAPNGKAYYYTSQGYSDNWVESSFPKDYQAAFLTPGDYSWQCYVGGKVIVSGGFQYSNDKEGTDILILHDTKFH